jgi:hypothetical protein
MYIYNSKKEAVEVALNFLLYESSSNESDEYKWIEIDEIIKEKDEKK